MLGDQVVKAFLAFRGLVELFLDVADELFGLFAGEVALVRVDAHVDGQVVARVFDDRVACRGLPRFRLVYDADRLGSALGRVRLLHGGTSTISTSCHAGSFCEYRGSLAVGWVGLM